MLESLHDSTHIKVLALKAFANLELEETAINSWIILTDSKFYNEKKTSAAKCLL